MKVLIIDRDMPAECHITAMLSAAGFEPFTLASYDDALNHILNRELAIIFAPAFCGGSDINVFTAKIRSFEDSLRSRTPIICISSIPMDEFFNKSCETDIFAYIEKPVCASELIFTARKAAFYISNIMHSHSFS